MKWWTWTCIGSLSLYCRFCHGLALWSYIELYEQFLIQTLLATFLSNAFALMFHNVLINFILLLTLYLFLICTWLYICSQLKDISLNVIMRCGCKNRTFSVRNLLPAGIKISAFFFYSQEYHPQPCEFLLALQIWIHLSVMKLEQIGRKLLQPHE